MRNSFIVMSSAIFVLFLAVSAYAQFELPEPGPHISTYLVKGNEAKGLKGLKGFSLTEPPGEPSDYFDINSQRDHIRLGGNLNFDVQDFPFKTARLSRRKNGSFGTLVFTTQAIDGVFYSFKGLILEKVRRETGGEYYTMQGILKKFRGEKEILRRRLRLADYGIL